MATFYFHLANGQALVQDEEGSPHVDLAAAIRSAVSGLRDVLAGDIHNGKINTGMFITIEDESRATVATVKFRDAVLLT